jgi:hypothetical protein
MCILRRVTVSTAVELLCVLQASYCEYYRRVTVSTAGEFLLQESCLMS